MKHIEVVAANIRKDDMLLATQRGYGDFKDWWEFPGGKMEAGETPEMNTRPFVRHYHNIFVTFGQMVLLVVFINAIDSIGINVLPVSETNVPPSVG